MTNLYRDPGRRIALDRKRELGSLASALANPYAATGVFQAKRQILGEEWLMVILHIGIHQHDAEGFVELKKSLQ